MTRPSRTLRACALALALLPLAGCGVLPKHEPIALYRPEAVVATDPAWPQANWQLRIARPYADDAHDSARILVRPQPGELQVYKGAAWTQPAPDLVLDTLLRAFGDSGRVAGVGRRGEGVGADYELLLDLRRFEADYADEARPTARIALGARLVRNDDDRVVASRVFEADAPADGTAVTAVDRAFAQGLGAVTTQLIGWTLDEGRRDAATRR
ncbi:MAG: membrane integrity-associated transporter subunit PqiC [Xanthomonadales bacterium]|nr:membrane integrity-associated transporter subunit PqiC [Xanthomonadales bacterium]